MPFVIATSTSTSRHFYSTLPAHLQRAGICPAQGVSYSPQNSCNTWNIASATEANPRLQEALSPAFKADLREFWFSAVKNEDQLIVPNSEIMSVWFRRDHEFDTSCSSNYGKTLELIESTGATVDEILVSAKPESALDWLSLLILMDQLPRNIYRGVQSRRAFEVFDPLAMAIARRAIEAGVPQRPEVKYRIAYRMWFNMPLMHSEELEIHEMALEEHIKLRAEVLALIDGTAVDEAPGPLASDIEACRAVLKREKNAVLEMLANSMNYEKMHADIIRQFGRYPHRNMAMSREPTVAESLYLENGGQTFGG